MIQLHTKYQVSSEHTFATTLWLRNLINPVAFDVLCHIDVEIDNGTRKDKRRCQNFVFKKKILSHECGRSGRQRVMRLLRPADHRDRSKPPIQAPPQPAREKNLRQQRLSFGIPQSVNRKKTDHLHLLLFLITCKKGPAEREDQLSLGSNHR